MDAPTPSTGILADETDLLLRIAALARCCAPDKYMPDDKADLAQAIVVESRAVDIAQRKRRRKERNAEHGKLLEDGTRVWMSPELALEQRELAAFHEWVVRCLPEACRRVYVMVRDECATYEVVGQRLGVSRAAVNKSVVRAHGLIREQLRARGIEPPRGGQHIGKGEQVT